MTDSEPAAGGGSRVAATSRSVTVSTAPGRPGARFDSLAATRAGALGAAGRRRQPGQCSELELDSAGAAAGPEPDSES